jgi:uncharacterized protein (TIGR03435 family)
MPIHAFLRDGIHPVEQSSQGHASLNIPPGGERFAATNVSLTALILTAYSITVPQCSCQSAALPVLSERFDIQAEQNTK